MYVHNSGSSLVLALRRLIGYRLVRPFSVVKLAVILQTVIKLHTVLKYKDIHTFILDTFSIAVR